MRRAGVFRLAYVTHGKTRPEVEVAGGLAHALAFGHGQNAAKSRDSPQDKARVAGKRRKMRVPPAPPRHAEEHELKRLERTQVFSKEMPQSPSSVLQRILGFLWQLFLIPRLEALSKGPRRDEVLTVR